MAIFASLALCACATRLAHAQTLPVWRLAERARFTIDGADAGFYRIRGAAFLPGGRVVVADAGNSRLAYFNNRGQLQRTAGRRGSGPGEFRSLLAMQAIGDTVLTYDPGLQRVTLWIDGTMKETIQLVPFNQRSAEFQAALSAHDFLAVTLEPFEPRRAGLFIDTVSVLKFDARTKRHEPIGAREWRYLFLYPQRNGHTTYRTPFLPGSYLLSAGKTAVFVPLTGAEIQILNADRRAWSSIPLPISATPFDRSIVTAYRDSLLELPGSEGPAADRLRAVFGDDFPVPANAPRIQDAVTVGSNVWIRTSGPPRQATSQWLVASVAEHRIVASIALPARIRVLGGDDTTILVLQSDDLDVESIGVYEIRR